MFVYTLSRELYYDLIVVYVHIDVYAFVYLSILLSSHLEPDLFQKADVIAFGYLPSVLGVLFIGLHSKFAQLWSAKAQALVNDA